MTKKTTTTRQTPLTIPRRRESTTGKRAALQSTPSSRSKTPAPIQLPTQPPTKEEILFLALHSVLHAEGGYKRWRLEDFPELDTDALAWEARKLCSLMIALAKKSQDDFAARINKIITAQGEQLEQVAYDALELGLQCKQALLALRKGSEPTERITLRSEEQRYRVEAHAPHSITISLLDS